MKKTLITILSLIVICLALLFVAKYVLDYTTGKVFDEITKDIEKVEVVKTPEEIVDPVEGNVSDKEEPEKEEKPSTKPEQQQEETEASKTEKAVRTVSSLTSQQLKEIQDMVTVTDKLAVINICKSALTKEDKKEVKQMLNSGKIDFGRCKDILSARLSPSQKQQIYAYYEKYINMYFNQ